MSGDRSRRTHTSRPWFPAARLCYHRISDRQTRQASASRSDIERRRLHHRSAVGTRSRSGESRSSGHRERFVFVICSITNLAIAATTFCVPGRRGIRLFKYYKHGYDLCIVAFGGILSAFSLQMISDHDLFPGLSKITWLSAFPDPKAKLGGFFVLCCVFTFLT